MTTMTSEQHQAVEQAGGEPVPIVDPQTRTEYYLVRADLFRVMSELLEEERERQVIARKARRNAEVQALG